IIAASLVIAAWLSYRLRARPHAGDGSKLEIGMAGLRRLAFPLAALTLVLFGRWSLAHFQTGGSLLSVAVPLLTAMAIIRFAVYMLRLVFAPGSLLAAFERTIGWLVWLGFAVHVLGSPPTFSSFSMTSVSSSVNIAFHCC